MEPEVKSQILGIYEFQQGIKDGIYTDAKGKAKLIIIGSVYNTYTVHINRKVVSSAGAVVSFAGLLKEYGPDNIFVEYTESPPILPNLSEYIAYRLEKTNRGKAKKGTT